MSKRRRPTRAEPTNAVGEIRALASVLTQRSKLARAAGVTFDGKRDLYEVCGFKRELLPEDYRLRYERNGIAARLVRAFPEACFSGRNEIIEDEDPETATPFELAVIALDQRVHMWRTFRQTDTVAGLGHYGVMLIGARGAFADELPKMSSPKDVLFLKPFSEEEARIEALDADTQSERFGQPTFYLIKRLDPVSKDKETRVHASRCIHVPSDYPLEDDLFGVPRLRASWNDFDNLEKIMGAGSEAYYQRVHQGMHLDIDPDAKIDAGELQKLKDAADEYEHGLSRQIRTKGTKLKMLGADVAPITDEAVGVVGIIAGSEGIPQRILLGSERGDLASTQDRQNWVDRVGERRGNHVEHYIVTAFIDRMITVGALPMPTNEDGYNVRWSKLTALDEGASVDLVVKVSQAEQASGEVIMTTDEKRDRYLGLPPLEDVLPDDELDDVADDEIDAEADPVPADPAIDPEPVAARFLSAPSYQLVNKAAMKHRAKFARAFTTVVRDARDLISIRRLELAIGAGDRERAQTNLASSLIHIERNLADGLSVRLLNVLAEGGSAAARSMTSRPPRKPRRAIRHAAREGKLEIAFDRTNPLAVAWARSSSSRLVTEVTEETRQAIALIIEHAFLEGQSPRETARTVKTLVGLRTAQARSILRRQQEMLAEGMSARDAANWAIREAERQLNRRAMDIARTECLPGETVVDGAVVNAVHRRWYDGDMVSVGTRHCRQLSATPNHPMLTRRGWIPAGLLRETDDLVCDVRQQESGPSRYPNVNRRPTPIVELFHAASIVGIVERHTGTHDEFHGDGRQGDVNVARPFWPLSVGSFAALYEPTVKEILSPSDMARATVCATCRRLLSVDQQPCLCVGASDYSSLSEAAINEALADIFGLGDLFRGHAVSVQSRDMVDSNIAPIVRRLSAASMIGAASIGEAAGYAGGPHNVTHPVCAATDLLSDQPGRKATQVEFDRVRSISIRTFHGHVYNLSTPYGYFTANDGHWTGNTNAASNEGVRQLWEQAIARGDLDANAQREWIAGGPNMCPRCEAMNGQIRRIDEPFVEEDTGEEVMSPTLHPNCTCSQGITATRRQQ